MRMFGSERIASLMDRMGYKEDEQYTLAFKSYLAAVRAAGPDVLKAYYVFNNCNPNL
jgi:hypothetical protein